jgi:hypothetical protein
MNAKDKMREAYTIWVFSWMIWHNTKSGKINYSELPNIFSIELGNGAISFKTTIPLEETEKLALNTVIAVTGVCFNTFHAAMIEIFGNFDDKLPIQTSGLSAARVIVSQIRNAYAHDPIHPKWLIRNTTHLKTFSINEIGLIIDLSSLNGCTFKMEHINGAVGCTKLLNYCLENVNDQIIPTDVIARNPDKSG